MKDFTLHVCDDMVSVTKAIPQDVTCVSLRNESQYRVTLENLRQLSEALPFIPSNVTELFSSGFFGGIDATVLTKVFRAIPPTVTSLQLSYSYFGEDSNFDLAALFAVIHKNVTSLRLGGNVLGMINNDAFIAGFSVLPKKLTELSLSDNDLFEMNATVLAEAFGHISETVTWLDLSENKLYEMSCDELVVVLQSIPAGVTSLNLSGNRLGWMSGDELARVFAAIPRGVTQLDLSNNNFCALTDDALVQAFRAISEGVISLNLSSNYFGERINNGLGALLRAIPVNVTSLDLGYNHLNSQSAAKAARIEGEADSDIEAEYSDSEEESSESEAENTETLSEPSETIDTALAEDLKMLSSGVTSLNLSGNEFFKNKTREQKDDLLIALRESNPTIGLKISGNGESDLQRALEPMVSFSRKKVGQERVSIPDELIVCILSFLCHERMYFEGKLFDSQRLISEQMLTLQAFVNTKPSLNDTLRVGVNPSPCAVVPCNTSTQGIFSSSAVDMSKRKGVFSDNEHEVSKRPSR